MLAKLLSLLIHAKSGAISGVLLLGATGALVSVSAANGVTTITITEASPSPSASVNHQQTTTTSPTPTPTPSPSSASPKLSSPSTSAACTDEAKALALQVKRVDTAFSGFHTDLMKLRGQRAADTLMTADKTLKLDRESAVRAIHATATAACLKQDDEDENDTDVDENDNDDDKPAAAPPATTVTVAPEVKQGHDNESDNDNDKSKTALITFTGNAASIADQAVAAMQTAFDTAKNAPVVTTTPKTASTHKVELKNGQQVPSKSPDHKGDHHD
jgi:hypothetical protein